MKEKRKYLIKILIWYLVLLLVAVLIFGCEKRIVCGIAIWESGILHQELNVYYFDLYEAVITALKELDLPIKEEKKEWKMFKIASQFDHDGHKIWIEIRSLKAYRLEGSKHNLRPEAETISKYLTEITIRVEHIGDKSKSFKLLETIHQYL